MNKPCPYFTEEEVKLAIIRLRKGKASGPDGVCSEHLKETYRFMAGTWVTIFNKCLEIGNIPENWKVHNKDAIQGIGGHK